MENFKQDLLSLGESQTLSHIWLELALMFSVSARQSQVTAHLRQGVDNILAGAAYQHVEEEGPRHTKVSIREDEELVAPYFTSPDLPSLQEEISLCWSPGGAACRAHNGDGR